MPASTSAIFSARAWRLRRARQSGKRSRLGFPAAFACQEHGAIGRDCNPLALGFANAFQINTACFDPLARKQIRSPVKCEILPGPQDDPRSIRGDGAIGDLIGFGGLLRCPGFIDTFELMGGARSQFSRESVQADRTSFTFRHNEQTAIRRDKQRFGVM